MRLIDADALVAELKWLQSQVSSASAIEIQEYIDRTNRQPTIEAAPVVHGRWKDQPTGRYGKWQSWCSVCRRRSGIGGVETNRHRAYCPNCGAKMDKEE